MASPTTEITRLDLSLTYAEFSLRANRRGFVGHLVFPPLIVAKQASDFLRVTIASVLGKIEDTLRKPKGTYKRGDFEFTKDSYSTDDHGVEEPIDKRQEKLYSDEMQIDRIHRDRALNRVLQRYEFDCAAAAFDGAIASAAAGTKWDVTATADPVADVDDGREALGNTCGQEPNAMLLPYPAFIKCIRTARVEELIKYSGHTDPKTLIRARDALADLFDIEEIIIPKTPRKNTADDGQAPVLAHVWDQTQVLLFHRETSDDLENVIPQFGRTYMWSEENDGLPGGEEDSIGAIIEEYEEPQTRARVIRALNDRQIKTLHKECGRRITGVL